MINMNSNYIIVVDYSIYTNYDIIFSIMYLKG